MVKAVFDELDAASPETPLHRRHRRRCDRSVAGGGRALRSRAGRIGPRGVLRSRRRRHGRREQELDQDHRRRDGQLRAGLLRLRLEEVRRRRRFRTCASDRRRFRAVPVSRASFVGCHQFNFLDRYDVLRVGGAGRRVPAERAVRTRRRSGTSCRSRSRNRSSRNGCGSSSSTPTRSRRARAWARASTRSCRRASSRSPACCRATRRSPTSSTPSRRPTASAARRWCSRTSRRSTRRSPISSEVAVPASADRLASSAAAGAGRGA